MRRIPCKLLEEGRILDGAFGSRRGDMHGAFHVSYHGREMKIISSGHCDHLDATGWEHVSVSLQHRVPNWSEMCFVKNLFWSEDECVIQYHPPRHRYVNVHPYCLHLWRPVDAVLPMPPLELIA